MTLAASIIGLLSGIISLIFYLDKKFKKSPSDKIVDIISDTDKALEKAKTGDTSDLEKLINS